MDNQNNGGQFIVQMCMALEQTSSIDNNMRNQAEGFIRQVSAFAFSQSLLTI